MFLRVQIKSLQCWNFFAEDELTACNCFLGVTAYEARGRARGRQMRMAHIRPPIVERFGKVLHEVLDPIAREPLPESWTEFLDALKTERIPRRNPASTFPTGTR